EGTMTDEMFAYVEQCLVQARRHPDDGQLPVHLGPGIRRAIEKAGPACAICRSRPDLNPIELTYSKFKALPRKVTARTIPGLHGAQFERSFLSLARKNVPTIQACRLCFNMIGIRCNAAPAQSPALLGSIF